jgi:hypothetical protein
MDETYQTLIYHERSGDRMGIQSAGVLELAGEDITGLDLRLLASNETTVVIEPAAGAVVLPILNLPKNVKVVTFLGSDTTQSAAFWLTSVSAGRDVFMHLRGDSLGTFTNASTQIDVLCSGCILLDSIGAAVSGFEMHTSIASDCGVHLLAIADNVWSIVSQFGDINT